MTSFFEALMPFPEMRDNKPEEIGRGGDQIVFRHPRLGDKVLKVSHLMLTKDLNRFAPQRYTPEPTSMYEKNQLEKAEMQVEIERLRHMQLKEVFGPHALEEVVKLEALPLSGRACRELWGESELADEEVRWFWTIIKHQALEPALLEPEKFQVVDFRLGYPETELQPTFKDFVEANQRWVEPLLEASEPWTNDDTELFLRTHGTNEMRVIMHKSETDEVFREILADFLDRSMQFVELSGESLDANKNNIIFFTDPDTQEQDYRLVDAVIPHMTVGAVDRASSVLRRASQGKSSLSRSDASALRNSLPFVRTLNALREYLSLPGRIEMTDHRLSDYDWGRIFLIMQRPLSKA